MKQLIVSKEVRFPVDFITQAVAILGNRGSGKTTTGVVLVEELLELGQQVIILDPLDVWYGLRSSYDGKKPGFPVVVFGGSHADLPLTPVDGAAIADLVVEHSIPTILSTRHFETVADQRRFVTDFARRLFYLKGRPGKSTPVMVVIDEASLFVPQRVDGALAPMVGAIQKLVRQGRASGIGVTLIDQRPATVNKDVLTQVEMMVVHRITSPHDRKAVLEWVQAHDAGERVKTFTDSLTSLPIGNAWFWSPGWLDMFVQSQVRQRGTFPSSATPKVGETRVTPKTLASIDIPALHEKLVAQREIEQQRDPRALQRRITELEQQLQRRGLQIDQTTLQTLQKERAAAITALTQREKEWGKVAAELRRHMAATDKVITAFYQKMEVPATAPKAASITIIPAAPQHTPSRRPPTALIVDEHDDKLDQAKQRILRSLYWLQHEDRTPEKVAFFANYTVNGHFKNMIGSLRSGGYVRGFDLTEKGQQAVPADTEPKPSGSELREWFRPKLEKLENDFLDILIAHGGERISLEQLCSEAGVTVNGHSKNMLGHMRTIQVAEGYAKDGGIKVSDSFL